MKTLYFNKKDVIGLTVILVLGIVSWFRVLEFWFLKAYEAHWLMSITPHTIINLIRSHSFLYYIDWKVFGWNPWGWYLTSLILHLIATCLFVLFVTLMTKKKLIGFLAGLLFVANSAYNDILTWGSFNSYYPWLLIWMLCSSILLFQYKTTHQKKWYFGSLFFIFSAFFIRETSLVLIPILACMDALWTKNFFRKKQLFFFAIRQGIFAVGVLLLLFARNIYGGTPGDHADSNVKYQIKLVEEKRYLEYAQVITLTFSKFIPPHFIPYPLLNEVRDVLMKQGQQELLQVYFFPIIGAIMYISFSCVVFLLSNHKQFGKILLFFWIWFTAFTGFVSLVIPHIPEVMVRVYEYNTARYRYFAFVSTATVLSIFFYLFYEELKKRFDQKKVEKWGVVALSIYILIHFSFIQLIISDAYETDFKPAKLFYSQFQQLFPTLPTNVTFYYYPHTNLNDYLLEWYFMRETWYPNLKDQEFRVESQMIAVLKKIQNQSLTLNDVIFLDYDDKNNLIDQSEKARSALSNFSSLKLQMKPDQVNTNLKTENIEGPFLELPYQFELSQRSSLEFAKPGPKADSTRFRALYDYNIERFQIHNTSKMTTSATVAQRVDEPFDRFKPAHLQDYNIGPRSTWLSDAYPSWIMIEQQEIEDIYAVQWSSYLNSRAPSTYTYFSSNDGQNWKEEKSIFGNTQTIVIDRFETPIQAKFLKVVINSTQSGDSSSFDEFELIGSKGMKAVDMYSNPSELLHDRYALYDFFASRDDLNFVKNQQQIFVWAKLSWESQTPANDSHRFVYFPIITNNTAQTVKIKIPESEYYANIGQFLKNRYTNFSLDFGSAPIRMYTHSEQLLPDIEI